MSDFYPLERQVCTPWQARKFLERLGDDAPKSLWVWAPRFIGESVNNYEPRLRDDVLSRDTDRVISGMLPAYTGDEIWSALPNLIMTVEDDEYPGQPMFLHCEKDDCGDTFSWYGEEGAIDLLEKKLLGKDRRRVKALAETAIKGLREGRIKPEEFRYA